MTKEKDALRASLCAITFQGNAKNHKQQDALFFNNHFIQQKNSLSDVVVFEREFCVAVADGVADSPLSQHASKALITSVQKNWQDYLADDAGSKPIMTMHNIQRDITSKAHQYIGAKSTLAMLYKLKDKADKPNHEVIIKHVGDSRIYRQPATDKDAHNWRCLTRDHNFLNDTLDEQAKKQGKTVNTQDYNQEGMASAMYMLTESFVLGFEYDDEESPTPRHDSSVIKVQAGDCFVVCTDGIHDLVPSSQWQEITADTDLAAWLQNLKSQVYASTGNAYDNGTAIVIRFESLKCNSMIFEEGNWCADF